MRILSLGQKFNLQNNIFFFLIILLKPPEFIIKNDVKVLNPNCVRMATTQVIFFIELKFEINFEIKLNKNNKKCYLNKNYNDYKIFLKIYLKTSNGRMGMDAIPYFLV